MSKLKGEMTTITSADGTALHSYHVRPEGKAKAGLVLVMEIFGVTDHIKELCDGYAAEGFEVVSPGLYDRIEPGFQASYSQDDIARAIKLRDKVMYEHTQDDIQACIDYLKEQGCPAVHITGYCYGGSVAWLAACRCTGLASAAGYYGRNVIDFNDEEPNCPTILHFGEKDKSIPMEWVRQIEKDHPEVAVYVYDADHGFNSDRRQNYDPEAAALARERTLNHFRANTG